MVECTRMGGMGNNMFQIATAVAYSLRYNMPYCISKKVVHPHYPAINNNTYNFPNVKYCDEELNLPIYTEPHYHYSEIPYMPDVCLNGYFQSWRYFNNYKDEIIKLFGFDDIETRKGVCSIHVRRGDYLDYPNHHPVASMMYLREAASFMWGKGYRNFKIFSDDMEWAKSYFENEIIYFRYIDIEYSEGKSEVDDLRDMASCESNTTANSSFSWWGAYINPNPEKKIVMPSRWFGSELNHNTKDLYLPGAIII